MKYIFIFIVATTILILYLNKHKINENYENYTRKNNHYFLNPHLTLSSNHNVHLTLNKICNLSSK